MYKLSILIAVYNDEQYLEECMDSLLSSTRQSVMYNAIHNNEVEILITNDHDNKDKEFIDIINKIKNKYTLPEDSIKYYINKENQGLLLNQCDMILKANGEYITFIDPDDHYNDNVYGEVFSVLNYTDINKKPELVICNAERNDFPYIIPCSKITQTQISKYFVLWTNFYLSSILKGTIKNLFGLGFDLHDFAISNDVLINYLFYSRINFDLKYKIINLTDINLVTHIKPHAYISRCYFIQNFYYLEQAIKTLITLHQISHLAISKHMLTEHLYKCLCFNLKLHMYIVLLNASINTEKENINDLLMRIKTINFNPIIFSICVTFYNQSKYVKSCIDSIINQNLNFDVIQLVIVNDCSTDNTDEEINKYINEHKDLNIKYIKHEHNMGVFEARRTCINNADGEYTIFVDGDDEFVENEFGNWIHEIFIEKYGFEFDLIFNCRYYDFRNVINENEKMKVIDENKKLQLQKYDYEFIYLNDRPANFDYFIKKTFYDNKSATVPLIVGICGNIIKTELFKSCMAKLSKAQINYNLSEDFVANLIMLDRKPSILRSVYKNVSFYKYYDVGGVNKNSLSGKFIQYGKQGLDVKYILPCFENFSKGYELIKTHVTNKLISTLFENLVLEAFLDIFKSYKSVSVDQKRVFIKSFFESKKINSEMKSMIRNRMSSEQKT